MLESGKQTLYEMPVLHLLCQRTGPGTKSSYTFACPPALVSMNPLIQRTTWCAQKCLESTEHCGTDQLGPDAHSAGEKAIWGIQGRRGQGHLLSASGLLRVAWVPAVLQRNNVTIYEPCWMWGESNCNSSTGSFPLSELLIHKPRSQCEQCEPMWSGQVYPLRLYSKALGKWPLSLFMDLVDPQWARFNSPELTSCSISSLRYLYLRSSVQHLLEYLDLSHFPG